MTHTCRICGGKKTIPDAELCGYCKIDVKKIYEGLLDNMIKNSSKNLWNQAKSILQQELIRKKYDNTNNEKLNSAGFPKEELVAAEVITYSKNHVHTRTGMIPQSSSSISSSSSSITRRKIDKNFHN